MTTDYMLERAYAEGFQAFSRCSDEKRVLFRYLRRYIAENPVRSLLDIGSGGDDLPVHLNALVKRYEAIEKRPECAKQLRDSGIKVHEREFPFFGLESTFDLVLASHSVPWHPSAYRPFIECAWRKAVSGGRLMLVQYNSDEGSEWNDFLVSVGLKKRHTSRVCMLRNWLQSLPNLETFPYQQYVLTAYVASRSREQLTKALGFVYGGGREDRAREFEASVKVARALENQYCDGTEYCFRFTMLVFELRRG